ncbi:MAG TPA: hypothetical protein VF236_05325 [Gaiellaceae bacterium]
MLDEASKSLVDEVATAAAKVGEITERQLHDREMLALFDRCRSIFGAVRLLAKLEDPDFGQEATILARPLITESLMLMELAAADETRRVELVVGWELLTLDDLEGLWREAQARGQDMDDQLKSTALAKGWWEEYARRRGAGTSRWRVDEKALADKHGREDYLSFRMMHHFVHGSAFAAGQRSSQEGDVHFVGGPAADKGWGKAAALQSASSLVFATRAVCSIFGWNEPPELDGLHKRIEAMDAEMQEAATAGPKAD